MEKRCEQGHFYDPSKYNSCPYCGVKGLDLDETRPHREKVEAAAVDDTHRRNRPVRVNREEDGTVGILPRVLGMNPVVGWLVCVEGKNRGRDYRIRAENNFIGRSQKMQICIENDDTVSRDKHAAISYNPRKNSFKLSPGDSSSLVYLNDEDIDSAAELKPYDLIQLGETKLIFVPFCGDRFQWDKAKEGPAE
jgi:hypothetical protein